VKEKIQNSEPKLQFTREITAHRNFLTVIVGFSLFILKLRSARNIPVLLKYVRFAFEEDESSFQAYN